MTDKDQRPNGWVSTVAGAHLVGRRTRDTHLAFVDHAEHATGEPLAGMLRPGNAGANDAGDQIAVLDAALAQLPEQARSRVLVRGDAGSGVKALLAHVDDLGLRFSVGMNLRGPLLDALDRLPARLDRTKVTARRRVVAASTGCRPWGSAAG